MVSFGICLLGQICPHIDASNFLFFLWKVHIAPLDDGKEGFKLYFGLLNLWTRLWTWNLLLQVLIQALKQKLAHGLSWLSGFPLPIQVWSFKESLLSCTLIHAITMLFFFLNRAMAQRLKYLLHNCEDQGSNPETYKCWVGVSACV